MPTRVIKRIRCPKCGKVWEYDGTLSYQAKAASAKLAVGKGGALWCDECNLRGVVLSCHAGSLDNGTATY